MPCLCNGFSFTGLYFTEFKIHPNRSVLLSFSVDIKNTVDAHLSSSFFMKLSVTINRLQLHRHHQHVSSRIWSWLCLLGFLSRAHHQYTHTQFRVIADHFYDPSSDSNNWPTITFSTSTLRQYKATKPKNTSSSSSTSCNGRVIHRIRNKSNM